MATEIAKAYVQIVPKAEGISKNLDQILNGSDVSGATSKAGSSIGKNLVNGIGTAMKVGAAAIGAAVTGISAVAKKAFDNYADYEQLAGGVETLFKDSANKVMAYANNAYKTAGLSANEYMETVTSFSASLLQSLDGDTASAAKKANQAIIDMSDNANKMGSSMESIQNAYQGFAKQNYTMLDNLKLGYGGTASEMYRLLQDAAELNDTFAETANFSIDKSGHLTAGYADIVEAIHIVQTEMGITGTTAEEASETISGSINQMKSAWTNFLTAMGNEDADPSLYLNHLFTSIETVADNIIPRIQVILPRLIEGLIQLINKLIPELPGILNQILPTLVSGAATLLTSFVTTIVPQLPGLVKTIAESLIQNLPPLLQAGKEMLGQLLNGFVESVPKLIEQGLPMLMEFTGNLKDNAGKLIEAGIDLLLRLGDGLIEGLPTMIQTIPTIVSNIANIINENAPKLIVAAATLIWNLAKGLVESIPIIIQEFPKIIKAIFDVWSAINWINLGKNVVTAIKNGLKNLPETLANIWANIKNGAGKMWGSIKTAITSPITSAKSLVSGLVNGIKSMFSGAWTSIKSITTSTFNAIKTAITNPISTAKTVIKGIVEVIKKMFKFTIALPHIKLPHFSIQPSNWKLGDLLSGSIPKLGISWYAKAMDNPYMFSKPTVVGRGFGDAGSEIVYGHDNLMRDIREASNGGAVDRLDQVITLLTELKEMGIVLDSGALVGGLAKPMDKALGQMAVSKARYV